MISIEHAVSMLQQGKLIAIPTETVYGLAGDASNLSAVQAIYTLKQRPTENPLIIHLPHIEAIGEWAIEIPPSAYQLAEIFWPGPLTLILKRHPSVLKTITGNQETVALRIPNHPLTLELLKLFGGGLVAPSANRYGQLSPTCAEHVRHAFQTQVEILDGGPCEHGIESTIISLIGEPTLLRHGSIPTRTIEDVLNRKVILTPDRNIKAPGAADAHYAPSKPLYIIQTDALVEVAAELSQSQKIDVLSLQAFLKTQTSDFSTWKKMPSDPKQYTQQLYATLHQLDKTDSDCILVELPPKTEAWLAVHDRLQRASRPLP